MEQIIKAGLIPLLKTSAPFPAWDLSVAPLVNNGTFYLGGGLYAKFMY
jgi:hypothetical protein